MTGDRFAPVLRELQPLSERFAAAGHRLFLVGGTVRDIVYADLPGVSAVSADPGADVFDIDATTTARPDEIKRCLQGWADAIWTQGERFGTIGAMKRTPDGLERVYEITTHRAEAYQDHSRKPDVEFSLDIHADLSRRDFTVNAMAIEVTAMAPDDRPVLVDPFGGMHDLSARVLRTPLSAEVSFSDDPLRMLRAARFISRYGLRPDDDLLRAVLAMADRLQIVSAERIRDELDKLLAAAAPGEGLRFVAETGLLQFVVPELVAAVSQPDEPCHPHLWAHTVALVGAIHGPLDLSFDRRLVRTAALLLPLGAQRAVARLRALRASNDHIDDVGALVALHHAFEQRLVDQVEWTDADVRRHVRDAGPRRNALHALVGADARVHTGRAAARLSAGLAEVDRRITQLQLRESLDDLGPQLDGAAVMAALDIGPGRAVGQALTFLGELRLNDGLLDEATLSRRLEEWWIGHGETI